jgi:hypothetical protein
VENGKPDDEQRDGGRQTNLPAYVYAEYGRS